ncbi:unnamed protein product, partial [Schistosoma haematobium]
MDRINEIEFKQLCRLLQIQTDVTINDLRKAYYRLAKNYHPDKNIGNESSTTHFILVNRAYQTLCNELHHRNIKRSLEVCKNSKWKEKKSSIVEQFLSDLQRQDIDWPKSNDLYNEYDNTYSPIDKLLNHLLEATVLKGTHSKKEQTSEQKHRVNPSQPTYTTSNFRVHREHQQESEIQVPSTNEKSIVSYCNDVNYLNSQNQSNLQPNKFIEDCSIIQSKNNDLNEWINEAQHLLDNIKASRKLSRLSYTPCLNNRRHSEMEFTNLIPIIDNPDMMRCLICYRKFKIDVATKHVETCTRKGNGTNSLGSTTATGYSPISFRARQYAEDLQKRTLHKPTLTPNNQSKNEVQRKIRNRNPYV